MTWQTKAHRRGAVGLQSSGDKPQAEVQDNRCDLCGPRVDVPFITRRGEQNCHSCLRRISYLSDPEILERTEKRLRAFGRSAAEGVTPGVTPSDNGDTARLYARMVELEKAGKVVWDSIEGNWVERPKPQGVSARSVDPYTPESLLDHFTTVRKIATGWKAACPAHEDRNPSLSISQGRETWLLRCWTGCRFEEIVRAAGIDAQRLWFK